MGSAINHCSSTSTALGSDSTGGFAWIQWAGGNDLTWGHTDKSNYPFGETLGKPQYITSTMFIVLYKIFSALSTPICGLNMMLLLGYMSSALIMFGLVRWLLKRNDVAVFAGFAAAFVPFHQLKSQSHINYVYSGTFIAIIWAYLWFISRPTYKKALLLALASSISFYFDGYFILITGVVVGGLFASSYIIDATKLAFAKANRKQIIDNALARTKYVAVSSLFLALLLMPILLTYAQNGAKISQSLATVRSSIKGETELYGARPIEFVTPSYNSAIVPAGYPAWRATKLHGSNFSESTLFMGYMIIILAAVALASLSYKKYRSVKLQEMPYADIVITISFVFLACFLVSVPAVVTILGHEVITPVAVLVKLTANWRVLSRLFLAMDPLVIILASLGLFVITKNRSRSISLAIVAACGLVLFLEYLPAQMPSTGDIYKNAPPIYQHLRNDQQAKVVAEYPLADFVYTPEIFTFQPIHNKTLVNSNDGSISKGPFDASIAGLNDPQTLGALKKLGVDVIVTHGFSSDNSGLSTYYRIAPNYNGDGSINVPASVHAYRIQSSVAPKQALLLITKGYDYLSVDTKQISHRIISNQGTMRVTNINSSAPLAPSYSVSFLANSICPTSARVSVIQSGHTLWSGEVGTAPLPISLTVNKGDFYVKTELCSTDITMLDAQPAN